MKDWFTLNEAADFSGLGNTTIRSKIKSGDLKAVKRPSKYGPRWEIHREALLGFVEEQPFIDGEDLKREFERPTGRSGPTWSTGTLGEFSDWGEIRT